jgi:hypothetical protein
MMLKSVFVIAITVICLGLIGLSPLAHAETFADRAVIEANRDLSGEHTFGEHMEFKTGVNFRMGQEFPAGTFFSGEHTYPGDKAFIFTGNGIIFGDGSAIDFVAAGTFGKNADFSAGVIKNGPDAGCVTGLNTYDEGTMFAPEQGFCGAQIFDKHTHFNDNTDFTAAVQTFREGMTFAEGSVFNNEQVFPVNTILSHGIVINEVECSDSACVPDPADVIAPGEKFGAGVDPAATFHQVRSNDKTFEVNGLGLTMTFDTVSTNGDIKADLVDPANVAGATLSGTTITATGLGPIVGNVIELSADTATITGDIVVTLPYQDSEVDNENNLTMYHYVNNVWIEEQNCSVNTTANTVTCTVDSLSPFGIGGKNNNSTDGGSERCSASHEFGKNKSLKVSQISYDIESLELAVHAYSTCGSIISKVFTSNNVSVLGLSKNQTLIDEFIAIYSIQLEESDKKFKITVANDRNAFAESFYIHDKSIIKKYTGNTGYTSEQQNVESDAITSNQLNESSEPYADLTSSIIEKSISIENEKQISNKKLDIEKVPIVEYIPEPIAEELVEYIPEPIAEELVEYIPEPIAEELIQQVCGVGTESKDGICKIIKYDEPSCFLFWCE